MAHGMTPEIKRSLGAKRGAKSHLIVHQMRMKGYTAASLARELGVSDQTVGRTIRGLRHTECVLNALKKLGISEKLLFDPRGHEVA